MVTARLRAQLDTCNWCESTVILALDAPVAAMTVRLDPRPLTAAQELQVRVDGRFTYDLIPAGPHRHEVVLRDQHRIIRRDHPVLPAHKCPGPVPASAAGALEPFEPEQPPEPPF